MAIVRGQKKQAWKMIKKKIQKLPLTPLQLKKKKAASNKSKNEAGKQKEFKFS